MYGHLSRLIVTDKLERCSRYSVGRTALLTDTQSCSGWGLHGILCYHNIGELLPRLSILTANRQHKNVHSRYFYQANCGGLFLLHCPGGHPRLTLSGTLSYAARTFLMINMIPRPYNKLKFRKILYHFLLKKSLIFLLFFAKSSKIK